MQTFTDLTPGSYTVTEILPVAGFMLTDLVCVETGGQNSTTTLETGVAAINLEAGETVTCTYTNIVVQPVCEPFAYAVNDFSLNDSQFIKIDVITGAITPLGPLYDDYDFEGLDLHPEDSSLLYASTGLDNRFGQIGWLFQVDTATGAIAPLFNVSDSDLVALAFRPGDNSLWAWAEDVGLYRIDLATGTSTLVLPKGWNVEALAWNREGTLLYVPRGRQLHVYNPDDGTLDKIADDLPFSVEGAGMRPDGLLALGVHGDTTVYAFDPIALQFVPDRNLNVAPYEDIEGITWVDCQVEDRDVALALDIIEVSGDPGPPEYRDSPRRYRNRDGRRDEGRYFRWDPDRGERVRRD
jgi:hypothetical protein